MHKGLIFKTTSALFLLGFVLLTFGRLFAASEEFPKILFADLIGDGTNEKIEIDCKPLGEARCAAFNGLKIEDKNGNILYEMKSQLDPEIGAFVEMFKVDQLRTDGKKQLIIKVNSNASLQMGDFRVVECLGGKFSEIFTGDVSGLAGFEDIKKDGNKEIVIHDKAAMPSIYEYSISAKKFVRGMFDNYKTYYEQWLKDFFASGEKNQKNPYELIKAMQISYLLGKDDSLKLLLDKYPNINEDSKKIEAAPSEKEQAKLFLEWLGASNQKTNKTDSLRSFCAYKDNGMTTYSGFLDIVKYYRIKLGLRELKEDMSEFDDEGTY